MARRYRGPRGAAWNEQVFKGSNIALCGGPVHRSIASIRRHSSLASLYVAARDRGWIVEQIGTTWRLYDASLTMRRVVGIGRGGEPVFGP